MPEIWPHDIDWNTIKAQFLLPIELSVAPPRRVVPVRGRSRMGDRFQNSCLGCLIVPMFALGVFLTLWAGLAALIIPFGASTSGTITSHELRQGTGKNRSHFLKFQFRVNGSLYSGEWPVGEETFKEMQDGDRAQIRYFPMAPGLRPTLQKGTTPWFHVFALGPIGILIGCVSGLILVSLFAPQQGKRWVKTGIVAPAVLVRRDEQKREYAFLMSMNDGSVLEITNRGFARDIALGVTEVALYLPTKPKSARLYRTLDFRGDSH